MPARPTIAFEEIVRGTISSEVQTAGPGPGGRLPLTAEMLLERPSGDIFGWTQNAGMTDAFLIAHRAQIAALAARYRLPAVYPFRDFIEAGGLLSYGNDPRESFHRAAAYADRLLKGAAPSELPVQAPVKFELVLNVKVAKALGLTIPRALLLRADQVIE